MEKITRKIQSVDTANRQSTSVTKKLCFFCQEKKLPTYIDSLSLRKFMTERGKIVSKARSGVCSKHQRRLSVEIKRARHLAMLPFSQGV